MERSPSITNLTQALAKFHTMVGKISKDAANPFFKKNYASLPHIIDEMLHVGSVFVLSTENIIKALEPDKACQLRLHTLQCGKQRCMIIHHRFNFSHHVTVGRAIVFFDFLQESFDLRRRCRHGWRRRSKHGWFYNSIRGY